MNHHYRPPAVSRLKAPVILLPPSEGKAHGGGGAVWSTGRHAFRELDGHRVAVRDAVRRAIARGEPEAARLLGVRGRHLVQALADWAALDDAPTAPAAARYRGVVWTALDPAGLDAAARRRLNARVLVPSGLWGLVAATDPVPAYRLKMGARVASIGLLAAFWRPLITPIVNRRAAGGWVVDLLPREHAAAVDPGGLAGARLLRVDLVEHDGRGAQRAVGHAGKTLKGLLARAILQADARDPDAIAAIRVPGLRAEGVTMTPDGATVVFARTDCPSAPPGPVARKSGILA